MYFHYINDRIKKELLNAAQIQIERLSKRLDSNLYMFNPAKGLGYMRKVSKSMVYEYYLLLLYLLLLTFKNNGKLIGNLMFRKFVAAIVLIC